LITISKQYNFKANDFFDYLDRQLIESIKKARNNDMPVVLKSGTEYEQSGAKVKITEYERGKVYAAHFTSNRFDIIIKYLTEDNDEGVKITFSEEMLHFERQQHSKLQTMFYNWQLKMGANKELKRMADNVYANMAA